MLLNLYIKFIKIKITAKDKTTPLDWSNNRIDRTIIFIDKIGVPCLEVNRENENIRIFTIAKELCVSSNDIIKYLKEKNIDVTSHMSSIDRDAIKMIYNEFVKQKYRKKHYLEIRESKYHINKSFICNFSTSTDLGNGFYSIYGKIDNPHNIERFYERLFRFIDSSRYNI